MIFILCCHIFANIVDFEIYMIWPFEDQWYKYKKNKKYDINISTFSCQFLKYSVDFFEGKYQGQRKVKVKKLDNTKEVNIKE